MNNLIYRILKIYLWFFLLLIVLTIEGCEKSPEIDESTMIDGTIINDSSILNPQSYLVSSNKANPTPEELERPVIILAHGFTASTYEWDEFRIFAETNSDVLVSQVLLGGHGRSYEAFKNTTWKDWQKPIIDEYRKLDSIGFKNISLAGASTGCPLILDFVSSKKSESLILPKNIFFIDPIVIPSSKALSMVKIVGPLIGYISNTNEEEEKAHYYNYTPQESLQQLEELLLLIRKNLEKGIVLSSPMKFNVYKSKNDGSADPVSAVLLYKGISLSDNSKVNIKLIDSHFHVFTRLKGRLEYTDEDVKKQTDTFGEIIDILSSN